MSREADQSLLIVTEDLCSALSTFLSFPSAGGDVGPQTNASLADRDRAEDTEARAVGTGGCRTAAL